MKLHYSQTHFLTLKSQKCFNTLWNYTTLKLTRIWWHLPWGFNTLWNYTTLKLPKRWVMTSPSFNTLWNYTTLKHWTQRKNIRYCFNTLWNYTTLKPRLCQSPVFLVLIPYEITLLSNDCNCADCHINVLIPYEITLLSNWKVRKN